MLVEGALITRGVDTGGNIPKVFLMTMQSRVCDNT